MARSPETKTEIETVDHDERVGEAIEAYLALAEAGTAPDPEAFAAGYPDLAEDLLAGLEGLAMVRGLVGEPETGGPGGRLENRPSRGGLSDCPGAGSWRDGCRLRGRARRARSTRRSKGAWNPCRSRLQ